MTIVQTSDYPVTMLYLKKFFCPAPVAPSVAIFPSGNVMTLQLPGDINKEAKAKKGHVKLMLFHIQGNVDIKATSVSSITAAIPSKGMQIIMNQNWASCASSFTDLMRMTINEAKAQDRTSIQSSQILIKLLSKDLASHMLQGNIATEKLVSSIRPRKWNHLLFFPIGTIALLIVSRPLRIEPLTRMSWISSTPRSLHARPPLPALVR